MLRITTERLVLRPVESQDCDRLLALRNHPEVVGSSALGSAMPLERMQRQVAGWVALWQSRGIGPWLIERDGRAVGFVVVDPLGDGYPVVSPDSWEIGVVIHPELWGQGIAREAAAAVVRDCASRGDVPRLYASVDPANERSSSILERAPRARLLSRLEGEHLYEVTTAEG
jgi:RimJ/RimL family protein N-acetyltransferase